MKRSAGIFVFFGLLFFFGITPILSADETADIEATVFAWRDAWQGKNVNQYISYYSPRFHSKRGGYKKWVKDKKRLFERSGDIVLELSDMQIKTADNRATVVFVQLYHGPFLTDVGKKELIMVKSKGAWKILSEKWEALNGYAHIINKPKTPPGLSKPNDQAVKEKEQKESDPKAPSVTDSRIIVNNIHYKIEKDGVEKVFVQMNQFFIPAIFALEGENPRIAVDIKNVSQWSGHEIIPVNGQFLKQIRTQLFDDTQTLRIVLDLNSTKNYDVKPTFFKPENIFSLEVRDSGSTSKP
ncbi:MAG: AMIN domain-containing protein [Desulfobacterales bacterium]|nr:AMIN domain-containing protein [Desulfobacterales bacterium]